MTTNSNLLRLKVGNEFFDEGRTSEFGNLLPYELIPDIFYFDFPNLNIRTGYIYFNLEIQQLGFGMWRGVDFIRFPDRNMIFPCGYRLNDGKSYWGTDIEVGWITSLVERAIKFTGSVERDILAEYGIYDEVFMNFLKEYVENFFKLLFNHSSDFYNHLYDNSQTLSGAYVINNMRYIFDAYATYGVDGLINLAKQKLGDTYEYVKNNPSSILTYGISLAVENLSRVVLGTLGLSSGGAGILAFLIASTLPFDQAINRWKKWKQQNGGGLFSFAKFMAHYIDPTNLNGNLFSDWADNIVSIGGALADWITEHKVKSWEDFLNEMSKYSPQTITEDLKFTVDITFEYHLASCNYGFAKYDGWFFPKYHIYKAYNILPSNYTLYGLIPAGDDYILQKVDLTLDNIKKLFNNPQYHLLILKNWKGEYSLLSSVIENENIDTLYIGSTYPSYIQMRAFGIPLLRIE